MFNRSCISHSVKEMERKPRVNCLITRHMDDVRNHPQTFDRCEKSKGSPSNLMVVSGNSYDADIGYWGIILH